jgi:hypothetical protein
MNFNELYKKIYDLDKPVIAEGCGDMSMGDMMGSDRQMPPAHPSMSVNLNAQGMDSIESLLRLMTKVNPDMLNKKDSEPALTAMPSIASIISTSDKPEMLPVMTDPESDRDIDGIDIGGDDDMSKAHGDQDGDGDHDMRDHELETDYEDDDKKEGAYDASTTPDPQYQDSDFMLNKLSGGLGKQQTMHKHSYKQGDNPMSMESVESIREGLTNLYQQYKAK